MVEDTFWTFVEQKRRDSLNVAAAEPASWDQGADYRQSLDGPKRGEVEKMAAKKAPAAGVHAAVARNDRPTTKGLDRPPRRYKFAELTRCTGSHPPWLCKAFRDKTPEERSKIIADNKLCPFYLLHSSEEVCYSRTYVQEKTILPGTRMQRAAHQVAA